MRVHEIMTTKPITAHPGDTVGHALHLMISGGFHHLPVMSSSKHLIGVVSSSDIRRALDVADIHQITPEDVPQAHTIKLREIMANAPVITVPEADIFDAAVLMYENSINCLPVMLGETLVGIVTTSDLMIAFIQTGRMQRAALQRD
jgi:acetoin utilization protein AcuB